MQVRLAADAAEFLAATTDLRAGDPVRTNILGSIAQSVVDGRSYERAFWFLAEDDDGTVVGAATWTLPYKLLVGPCSPDVVRAIGAAAVATGVPVHGAIVPVDLADAVAEGVGRRPVPHMGERILALGDYLAPDPVPGLWRAVGSADLDLIERWLRAFADEAGILLVDSRAAAEDSIGRLWLWEVDAIMLYTDAANPTSNAVYERIGFRHVGDIVDLDLEPV